MVEVRSTAAPRLRTRRRGVELDVRTNSLNLIRLVLAAMVLLSHAFVLGGFGPEPVLGRHTLGTWAVYGFFVLSGYLITASRFSHRLVPYLLKRLARIMPAFLACNVVVAFVVAPLAWLLSGRALPDLFAADHSPVRYVVSNAALYIHQYDIGGGPLGVPFPRAWNGSLWSLYYEFLCYVSVGLLALHPAMRRPRVVAGLLTVTAGAWGVLATLGVAGQPKAFTLLFALFLGGALLQTLVRDGLVLTTPGAVVAGLAGWAVVALTGDWGPLLSAPLLAYVLLWVSTVLPSPALVQRHDISYGCYIYAFPVQQLLAGFGLHRAGIVVYVAVTSVVTTGLAVLSWRHLESPAVRLAGRLPRLPRPAAARPRLRLEHGPARADALVLPAATTGPATDAAVAAAGVVRDDGADVAERVS